MMVVCRELSCAKEAVESNMPSNSGPLQGSLCVCVCVCVHLNGYICDCSEIGEVSYVT